MLLLHILRCHQLLVPDFDLLSVVAWGASNLYRVCLIFVAIVAGGAYGGAPAAWLHCL